MDTRSKLFYGFGSVAFGVKDNGFSYLLLLFYNQVVGLAAPLVGLAHAIVDIVETGTTLRENDLEVLETVAEVSTLLIANRAAYKLRAGAIRPLVERLRAVVG